MVEAGRVPERLEELIPILDVRLHVGYFRVENVAERSSPQKDVADYSHAFRVLIIRPNPPKAHHCCQIPLQLAELLVDALVGRRSELADSPEDLLVSLDEGHDGLSVIFGDVLGLITGDLPSLHPAITKGVTFSPWS